MDWGSLVARRANRNRRIKADGMRSTPSWGGLTVSNPGNSYPLRSNGRKGWFGWPTDNQLEAMRLQWFDAPDLAAQQAIAAKIQLRALEIVP